MGEAKVCGFLCLCLPDSTFFCLGMPFQVCSLGYAYFFGGSKHSPYIHNLQWQCQPIKGLDCLLMPRDCWPIRVMWLEMTHTDSCYTNQEMTHSDSCWLNVTHPDSCCARLYCAWSISLWHLAMYLVMEKIWNGSFSYVAEGWYICIRGRVGVTI